jgi:hypothetical protein
MKVVKVLYGQTISDIAVQELGDAERSMELAALNGMSVTDDLSATSTLLVPDYDTTKRNIVQLFSDQANAPASADVSGDNTALLEGIGYWYLENDFVVQ